MSINLKGKNLDDFFDGTEIFLRKKTDGITKIVKWDSEVLDPLRKIFIGKIFLESEIILKKGYLKNFGETEKSSLLISGKVNKKRTYVQYKTKNSSYEFWLKNKES